MIGIGSVSISVVVCIVTYRFEDVFARTVPDRADFIGLKTEVHDFHINFSIVNQVFCFLVKSGEEFPSVVSKRRCIIQRFVVLPPLSAIQFGDFVSPSFEPKVAHVERSSGFLAFNSYTHLFSLQAPSHQVPCDSHPFSASVQLLKLRIWSAKPSVFPSKRIALSST